MVESRVGSGTESRTPVSALRGQRPGPLDDTANVLIPVTPSTAGNPGSLPCGSAAGDPNESVNRSTGSQTTVCAPRESIPDSEQKRRKPIFHCGHCGREISSVTWNHPHVSPRTGAWIQGETHHSWTHDWNGSMDSEEGGYHLAWRKAGAR